MGNAGAIFATLPSVLLALAQGGLHTPSGSQFAGRLQNDKQDLITTGSGHGAGSCLPYFFFAGCYLHTNTFYCSMYSRDLEDTFVAP